MSQLLVNQSLKKQYHDEIYKNLSPFFLEGFLKSRSSQWGYYIHDDIVIPIVFYKKIGIKYAQIVACPQHVDDQSFDIVLYLDGLNEKLKSNVDFLINPSANAIFKAAPTYCNSHPFGTYWIDLNKDVKELWRNVHSKHRNVIRNAEKKGCSIEISEDLDQFHELLTETYFRSRKKPPNKEFLSRMMQNLNENSRLLFVRDANMNTLGGIFLVWTMEGCYYYHGASILKPLTGAMNFLHWHCIKEMKYMGVKKYDFMGARINVEKGSKYESIQKFKQRFGCDLNEGVLWKTKYSLFKYYGYQCAKVIKTVCRFGR